MSFADPRFYRSNELTLCRSLARLGHEVTLFTSNRPPKWQMLEKREVRPKLEVLDGFEIRRFHAGPEFGNAPLTPAILSEVFRFEFDVIHTHEIITPASLYSALASILRNKPLIVTQHDYAFGNRHGVRLLAQIAGNSTSGRFVARTARTIIALSSEGARFAQRCGAAKGRVTVIPNSVDTNAFTPEPSKLLKTKLGIEGKVVLYVGRLIKRKGVDILIRAFRDTIAAVPDSKLVIVGKGPEEQNLRNLQKQLNLDQVFFIGNIPRSEMPEVYRGCDVFVLAPLHYEIFGNVIIEAMASGLPVICTKVGGIIDLVIHGENGFLVAPGNSKELGRYLTELLADETLREDMSKAARRLAVEKFDDLVVARAVERIYVESLGI